MTRRVHLLAVLGVLLSAGCDDAPRPAEPRGQAAPRVSTQPPTPPWPALGKESQIAANPLARNYYLVFDASGSMAERDCTEGGTKLAAAKLAVAAFARSIPADANVGLAVFGQGGISERLPLAASSREQLGATINRVTAGGGTPLGSAMQIGVRALTAQGRRQLGYGEYHLVVITDGEFNPSSEDPRPVVDQVLVQTPMVLHTLGFCLGEKHSLNQPGRVLYKAANSQKELEQGLAAVLAESPEFRLGQFQ
ncbi:MAG: VWA domain-containing protein [Betaproteobacteria bacterium]|nr:VWA domain-containing protein [Betaproteobacteria bacterium]